MKMEWKKAQIAAAEKLRGLLAMPMAEDCEARSCEDFDPWEMFPCLYGSYSSDFDNMALEVLVTLDLIREDRWGEVHARQAKETLAHKMFREMLCTADLCDYGTSPRVCFPNPEFAELLPEYIAKWKAYYEMQWGEPGPPNPLDALTGATP